MMSLPACYTFTDIGSIVVDTSPIMHTNINILAFINIYKTFHFDIVNQSQADVPLFTQPFIAFTAPSGLSYTFTVSRSTPVDENFVNITF